jgi:hypothetical protein
MVEAWGMYNRKLRIIRRWALALTCLLASLAAAVSTRAAVNLSESPAAEFFTNVAARLLKQQLNVDWGTIQVAPTNQYDRAVHRLLQLTANLYDATSTSACPSVFRPTFTTNSGTVFLSRFTADSRASTFDSWMEGNPHRIPPVLAARKGFPAFNEFVVRSDVILQRRLQLLRATNTPGARPVRTNQSYSLTLSNNFVVELWHPFAEAAPYPRPVAVTASNSVRWRLANLDGEQANVTARAASSHSYTGWTGGLSASVPFRLALDTNLVAFVDAIYVASTNAFQNLGTNTFETTPGFPLLNSVLTVSNQLTVIASDPECDCLVDVALVDDAQSGNLTKTFFANQNLYPGGSTAVQPLWSTNRSAAAAPTAGVLRQMDLSLGNFAITLADWREYTFAGINREADRQAAVDSFRYFCGMAPVYGVPFFTNSTLAMQVPYVPAAKASFLSSWEAIDPLVRVRSEMRLATNLTFLRPRQPGTNTLPSSPGRLNNAYAPWNGNPETVFYPEFSDRRIKDAGATSPDRWNFPTNEPLARATHWLGRIHRGTPWQSLYLQADVAPPTTWLGLGHDPRTHPTNDWRAAALLAELLNTNPPGALRSVNATNIGDWQTTLTGLTVLSNNATFVILGDPPQFETNIITLGAPQAMHIAETINRERTGRRGQYFPDVATFLSVPELSSASPWLNLSGSQAAFGVTDEAYEMLPSQLLSRVRPDPVLVATPDGTSVRLEITSFPGLPCQLETSTNLVTWTSVGAPHIATNGQLTLTVPSTSRSSYFRVVVP